MKHEIELDGLEFHAVAFMSQRFVVRPYSEKFNIGDTILFFEVLEGQRSSRAFQPSLPVNAIVKNIEGLEKGYCILGW